MMVKESEQDGTWRKLSSSAQTSRNLMSTLIVIRKCKGKELLDYLNVCLYVRIIFWWLRWFYGNFLPCRWLASDEESGHIVKEFSVSGSQLLQSKLKTLIKQAPLIYCQSYLSIPDSIRWTMHHWFTETTYNVYVKTGDVSKAGTDANVHLKIFGEKGDTGILKLENAESTSNKFERNRTDHFVLHAEDIGKVCKRRRCNKHFGFKKIWLPAFISKAWNCNVNVEFRKHINL